MKGTALDQALISLTTTGRRTGRPREVELYAFDDGDRVVVVGSRGGSGKDPAWAANLRSLPRAVVRRDDQEWTVRAYEASGAERDRLWEIVCAGYPVYEWYQSRTARTIPIFVLEPASAGFVSPLDS